MARRRRGRTNYKQIKTGTVNLGLTGAQYHIASVEMIDDALKGSFLKNIQYSVMANNAPLLNPGGSDTASAVVMPAFTIYLSYESTTWDDDSVIAVSSTGQGGGNGSLGCNRWIKTNSTGSTVAEQIGPVHVWMECTDTVTPSSTDIEARVTLTAWGRMILLKEDF